MASRVEHTTATQMRCGVRRVIPSLNRISKQSTNDKPLQYGLKRKRESQYTIVVEPSGVSLGFKFPLTDSAERAHKKLQLSSYLSGRLPLHETFGTEPSAKQKWFALSADEILGIIKCRAAYVSVLTGSTANLTVTESGSAFINLPNRNTVDVETALAGPEWLDCLVGSELQKLMDFLNFRYWASVLSAARHQVPVCDTARTGDMLNVLMDKFCSPAFGVDDTADDIRATEICVCYNTEYLAISYSYGEVVERLEPLRRRYGYSRLLVHSLTCGRNRGGRVCDERIVKRALDCTTSLLNEIYRVQREDPDICRCYDAWYIAHSRLQEMIRLEDAINLARLYRDTHWFRLKLSSLARWPTARKKQRRRTPDKLDVMIEAMVSWAKEPLPHTQFNKLLDDTRKLLQRLTSSTFGFEPHVLHKDVVDEWCRDMDQTDEPRTPIDHLCK